MKTAVHIPRHIGVLLCFSLILSSTSGHAQNIDFGKSYINVSKGLNGGTVEPGDTLEIRASVVVRSGTYDSVGYYDVVPAGTAYIPGTIRVLTNEGKIYKQFTDAAGDDPGRIVGNNITIHMGYNPTAAPATAFRRGRIANTHRPSFYGSTCIMIASFRVRVTAPYGSYLSIGGGTVTYRRSGNPLTSFTFPARTVAVYQNVGICPNAVGANALGTEFNGTFGSGKARNRGTSPNVPVGYTYNIFTSSGPNDYYYGIPNNTSINTGYTTTNSWPKPDGTHRVFSVWDIIGDHTGAADPELGNPPADTVANNDGGYMLVINAAYRIDSAFQQTISGLCPNTYYEISLWMRNICSRCGCDSAGRGASSAGYIPTAPGDSSGVYPNLSFNVDGIDYYTTGNILYTGKWVKKGFTFQTGPSQTSFTLKVFNNAPGGGGNDWALDDISVATCSPNLNFTPNNAPTVCAGNTVDIGAYIRSYFDNYVHYKWQRSTDDGVTWTDAGPVSEATPVWNGSEWEYYTAFPTFVANVGDSGLKFRVVVASTASNISNSSCAFADATSILTLNVLDCGSPLSTSLISFAGKIEGNRVKLNWTTSKEEEPVHFTVEKSSNGSDFSSVATVPGHFNGAEINYYEWSDNHAGQVVYYRVRMKGASGEKISKIIKLSASKEPFSLVYVPNPFTSKLVAEISAGTAQSLRILLIDNMGRMVRNQQVNIAAGTNTIVMEDVESLPRGLYTLQIRAGDHVVNKKVMKQ